MGCQDDCACPSQVEHDSADDTIFQAIAGLQRYFAQPGLLAAKPDSEAAGTSMADFRNKSDLVLSRMFEETQKGSAAAPELDFATDVVSADLIEFQVGGATYRRLLVFLTPHAAARRLDLPTPPAHPILDLPANAATAESRGQEASTHTAVPANLHGRRRRCRSCLIDRLVGCADGRTRSSCSGPGPPLSRFETSFRAWTRMGTPLTAYSGELSGTTGITWVVACMRRPRMPADIDGSCRPSGNHSAPTRSRKSPWTQRGWTKRKSRHRSTC